MGLRFVYQYPDFRGRGGDMLDAGSVADVARAAEAAGWSGLSFTEHPAPSARWLDAGGHQSIDPFVALAHAAAVTERLRLLTFLSVLPYRNPLVLGKTAATVDKLSGGRLILGVGAGYLKAEYHAVGVDFDERNELFDEALQVLPLYWRGEPFTYEGRHFSARDVIGLPRPVQQPIPIWIGGNARLTRQRVAERAQGWMPLLGSAELSGTARTPQLSSVAEVASAIAEVKDAAGDRADHLDFVLTYPAGADRTISAEHHRDALGELERAGATWVVVGGTTRDPGATLAFIGEFGGTFSA